MAKVLESIGGHLAWARGGGPEGDVVLTTRVRLARNLEGCPFPGHASEADLEKVMEEVLAAVRRVDSEKSLSVHLLEKMTRLERTALAERYLSSGFHVADTKNRALILSDGGAISLMVNEEDHLRMQCILPGMAPARAWDAVDRLESLLAEQLAFAYSEEFGYLTSYLSNVGTGLRVSVMVHLPALALTGKLEEALKAAATLSTTVRGVYGEGSRTAGNLYQISNRVTLGLTEEEIAHRVSDTAGHLIGEERAARTKLRAERKLELQDRVFRAWGILTNARKISTVEAMALLSDLRLGVDLGFLRGVSIPLLTELLFAVRPAWLQLTAGYVMDAARRDAKRAELIRETLGGNGQG